MVGSVPNRPGVGLRCIHWEGLLFVRSAPVFGSNQIARGVTRGLMEPACQHDARTERTGFASQVREDLLSYVLAEFGIATGPAQRDGIDEVRVARDQFGESSFRTVGAVAAQEFLIVEHERSLTIQPGASQTGQKTQHWARSMNRDFAGYVTV